ncbi:MAG: cytochrome c4, partial [Proteobacteria bacterium]
MLGIFASLALPASGFAGGDAEAGAQKIAVCASCHGQTGLSISPEYPSLAGQVPGYLEKQLRAYKSGERQNAITSGMVAALSEQDMMD